MTAHNGIRFTTLVLYLPYQYMRYEYDSKLQARVQGGAQGACPPPPP